MINARPNQDAAALRAAVRCLPESYRSRASWAVGRGGLYRRAVRVRHKMGAGVTRGAPEWIVWLGLEGRNGGRFLIAARVMPCGATQGALHPESSPHYREIARQVREGEAEEPTAEELDQLIATVEAGHPIAWSRRKARADVARRGRQIREGRP